MHPSQLAEPVDPAGPVAEPLGVPWRSAGCRLVKTGGRWALTVAGSISSPLRPLPDFLIIGAKRSGTTSLFRALEATPGVRRLRPAGRHLKGVHYFDRNFGRGERWYRGHFPLGPAGRTITGEASPYYLYHPAAASRAASCVPGARLIVLLRDPAQRAVSHYRDEVKNGRESLTLAAALRRELDSGLPVDMERLRTDGRYYCWQHEHLTYLEQGRYVEHLRRWRVHFPPDQTIVLRSEDLFGDPAESMHRLALFLELPALAHVRPLALNRSRPAPGAEQASGWLAEYFQPYNEELQEFLGAKEPWW